MINKLGRCVREITNLWLSENSSCPLSTGATPQSPQRMPKMVDSTKSYAQCACFLHILMTNLNLPFKQRRDCCKNEIEQL